MAENQHTSKRTDAQRKRAVRQAFDGKSPREVAERFGVSASSLYLWCQDRRYGGKAGGLKRHFGGGRTGGARPNGVLPTQAKPPSTKAKALVPIAFACPHCGGRITAEEV